MKSLIKLILLIAFLWSGAWLVSSIRTELPWHTYLTLGVRLSDAVAILKEVWEPGAAFLGSVLGFAYYYVDASEIQGKNDQLGSPFEVVEVRELASAGFLHPTDMEIPELQSVARCPTDNRFQVIGGGPGVGKTRYALECIELIAKKYRAEVLYIARRYVDEFSAIPQKSGIRRVIVVIDDYDQGYLPSSGSDFMERYSAGGALIANLIALKAKLSRELELLGMVVTVNSHRLPLDGIVDRLSECDFLVVDLKELDKTQFLDAFSELTDKFSIEMDGAAIQTLQSGFDGRLDTLAALVHEFKGCEVSANDVDNFLIGNKSVWEVYRERLSTQQREVYDVARMLWISKIRPKIEYFYELTSTPENVTETIIKSNWLVRNGVVILYDGQFRGSVISDGELNVLVDALLNEFELFAKIDRHGFQNDLKCLAQLLIKRERFYLALRLLGRAISIYPKDRFFAYLYSDAHRQMGGRWHIFLAIRGLYRIFRDRSDFWLIFASGKWVEVRARVLLAEIYQTPLIFNEREPDVRKKIQREYDLALALVEDRSIDVGIESYRKLKVDASGVPLKDNEGSYLYDESGADLTEVRNHLSELGLIRSDSSQFDYDRLKAYVYHSMAKYASRCSNSEHLTLKYESLVAEIVPDFGEALLSCAEACLSIGNERDAIRYLNMTDNCGPKYQTEEYFRMRIGIARSLAYADLGMSNESFGNFNAIKVDLNNESPIRAELNKRLNRAKCLNELRDKEFSSSLIYSVKRIGFQIELPSGWKISDEVCRLDQDEYFYAGLSSPTEWGPESRQPGDAFISISYETHPPHAPRTSVVQYLNDFFGKMKARDPADWFLLSEVACANGRYFAYEFNTKSVWPKTGCIQIMNGAQERVVFITMCQKNVSNQFFDLFERLRRQYSISLADI